MGSAAETEPSVNLFTKEFLQEPLENGEEILSFSVSAGSKPGDNYLSIMYALEVDVKSREGNVEKRHWICKTMPLHPMRQSMLKSTNVFEKELFVYSKWIPSLYQFQREVLGTKQVVKLPFAPLISGKAVNFDDPIMKDQLASTEVMGALDQYITMLDMRKNGGFAMANRLNGSLNHTQVTLAMEAYATVHAASWAYKKHYKLESIVKKFPTFSFNFNDPSVEKLWEQMIKQNSELSMKVIEATEGIDSPIYKGTKHFSDICMDALESSFDETKTFSVNHADQFLRIRPEARPEDEHAIPWKIIIHGDCWTNNLLFRKSLTTGKDEEILLIDLQMCRETCPTNDLGYFLYANTDHVFRKKHLHSMLALYHDKFVELCDLWGCDVLPGFTFDELLRRFHRSKLLGYCITLMGLPLMMAEQVMDMEKMEGDMAEMFAAQLNLCKDNLNPKLKDRVLGAAQEMYDEGII